MKEFLIKLVTAHTGISSKRVCGVVGFTVEIGVLIYCTINVVQATTMIEPFMYVICPLLGIDSITGIFYNRNKENGI